jgi:lipoate-protein ligase A
MKNKWRYILSSNLEGKDNMAIDAALLSQVSKGESLPTIRVYTWSPPAITIGYFQKSEVETNREKCMEDGIPVIRRITGGGAVFHDHEITYSIICPDDNTTIQGTILESYQNICKPLLNTLKSYSLDAEFSGINDITVKGKKVSGNAQTRRMHCILQHGTLLLKVEPEKMFNYLNVPEVKIINSGITTPETRVTAMNDLLGEEVMSSNWIEEFIERYIKSCSDDFSIDLEESLLTDCELELVEKYKDNIYGNNDWNINRNVSKKDFLF